MLALALCHNVTPVLDDGQWSLQAASPDEVTAELAQEDDSTARVYESWKNFKDAVINYNGIAEEAFIEARKLSAD